MTHTHRPKNIILFSDGTGNSSSKLFKTNVWRLYQALDLSVLDPENQDTTQQIAYYDDGVGTSSFKPLAILGGAFGWGLKRNVIDLYTFLCWNYTPGDQIYCFGFSRGAFTIRVLVALIQSRGIKKHPNKRELRQLASKAFRTYRFEYQVEHYRKKFSFCIKNLRLQKWLQSPLDRFFGYLHCFGTQGTLHCENNVNPPQITFLGLWDTVAAYGLPIEELTRAWDAVFPLSTPNRDLSTKVERACHALALDDERNSFHPVLWNEEKERGQNEQTTHIHQERVSQVWFSGAHSNVGGGYPDDGLAHVSLDWMMGEANENGLYFKTAEWDRIRSAANPFGKIYDARHGLGGAYRFLPRNLDKLIHNEDDHENPVIIRRPKIHESVITRIKSGVDGYAPFVLPAEYAVVKSSGDIINRPNPEATEQRSDLIETTKEAEDRASRQEWVWNLVWWKRIAYFTSIIVAGALATFPIYRSATEACSGPHCFLSPIVNGVGIFLPSLANPWLEAFKSHPGEFFILALLLAILIYIGSILQDKMRDVMRGLWNPLRNNAEAPSQTDSFLNTTLLKFRSNGWYQAFFKIMKQRVLPSVAGVMALVVITGCISQGFFAMWSSAGHICSETKSKGPFKSSSLCWASGVELEEGKQYLLTFAIEKMSQWKDRGIQAGIEGFSWEKMTLPMYSGLPMRRHIGEPWFKPIARIGRQGADEYPLTFTKRANSNNGSNEFVAQITARRDGELFLFVNDAILPLPEKWQFFYKNNTGTAIVTVKPVDGDLQQQIALQ